MVRYVFNSWRRRHDLLLVRRQFYPGDHRDDSRDDDGDAAAADDDDDDDDDVEDARQLAVGRVSMWMTRQHCPHLVESTALLTAALLTDEADDSRRLSSSCPPSVAYAVRAAYAAAFSRFVTGLLDGHQDKLRKQSMYTIAASIGLPSAFVELRHQSTHEQLPSRARLRAMAERALVWIWDYYWKHLDAAPADQQHHPDDDCRAAVLAFLRAADDVEREASQRAAILCRWDRDRVLATISRLQNTLPGNQAFLKCLSLSRHVMEQPRQEVEPPPLETDQGGVVVEADANTVYVGDDVDDDDDDDDDDDAPVAWSLLDGHWKPIPIGVRLPLILMVLSLLSRRQLLVQIIPKLAARRAMHIQSIPMWVGSSNNYAYLVVDDKSKDAVIIDPANPPEVTPVLKKALEDGSIKLKAIVNTHHHWDHAGGNKKLLAELDAVPNLDVVGGKDCEAVTKTPAHGETWKLGDISVKSVHTPCHTQDSICYLMEDQTGRAVFTGDTLFVGGNNPAPYLPINITMSDTIGTYIHSTGSGCGKFFEGSAAEMHEALNKRLASLPDDTVVYPGHEYTASNAKFAMSVQPSEAVEKLQRFAADGTVTTGKFTIGDEKKHNVFMRVEDPEIQKVTGTTEPIAVLEKLRDMKNNFK
ncbi:hypothetical protein L249_4878 [Ophiocordyceps polyrhachis-furcata BCC 54312]|uniref:hydroxyacylglutathione hydrolase n=1 Tax=Ophiocordyceps polyrhachis-furcata BCC 54312 TaxID=1330021 RepID=A0A367L2I5_9HYPO|nr:hypothetical protein L249_4878 [Ophiocordyceps polyrhachis-furcata BCC 54312]